MSPTQRFTLSGAVALAFLVPMGAHASCGSAFCSVNTSSAFLGAGLAGSTRVDLRFEFVDQKEPMHGSERVAVGEISEHHDEVRTTNRNLLLSVEHDLPGGWSIGATLPLVDRKHHHIHNHHHGGELEHLPERWDFTEVGDLRINARHELLAEHHRSFGLSAGLKLPTGATDIDNDDGDEAERSLQPGTGTTDLLVGAHWRQELTEKSRLFVSASAEISGSAHDDFRPGNRYHLDLGWQHALSDRLTLPVQLNLSVKQRDGGAEAEPEDSGGSLVALSPGVSYSLTQSWQAYAFFQKVLHQHVNGLQLTANWSAVLGTTLAF